MAVVVDHVVQERKILIRRLCVLLPVAVPMIRELLLRMRVFMALFMQMRVVVDMLMRVDMLGSAVMLVAVLVLVGVLMLMGLVLRVRMFAAAAAAHLKNSFRNQNYLSHFSLRLIIEQREKNRKPPRGIAGDFPAGRPALI
jgi:hypothetical protein